MFKKRRNCVKCAVCKNVTDAGFIFINKDGEQKYIGDCCYDEVRFLFSKDDLKNNLQEFRVCDECGKVYNEGFVVCDTEHYCSEECLYKHYTPEEYQELYDENEAYWTQYC